MRLQAGHADEGAGEVLRLEGHVQASRIIKMKIKKRLV